MKVNHNTHPRRLYAFANFGSNSSALCASSTAFPCSPSPPHAAARLEKYTGFASSLIASVYFSMADSYSFCDMRAFPSALRESAWAAAEAEGDDADFAVEPVGAEDDAEPEPEPDVVAGVDVEGTPDLALVLRYTSSKERRLAGARE